MTVTARFKCSEIRTVEGASHVKMVAAMVDGQNKDWSKFTPSGEITMMITNPAAIEEFRVGSIYAIDLTRLD